ISLKWYEKVWYNFLYICTARIHTNNSRKTVTVPMLLRTVTKISPQSEKQYIRKKGKTYG
ncbi:hypothetical protein, partial [Blautia sp.]|uniref:hypothetical protein n=1 Tax=Blautia sp. TaxID=1955243 RepID=UPI003AB12495